MCVYIYSRDVLLKNYYYNIIFFISFNFNLFDLELNLSMKNKVKKFKNMLLVKYFYNLKYNLTS